MMTTEIKTIDQMMREALVEEIARIENTAQDARYGGDHLREFQLSSIARRLRKIVALERQER